MKKELTKYQKVLLTELLDKYENSKTYQGLNQVNQSFYKIPSQIFKEYASDFTDFEIIRDFEDQMKELEEFNLITIEWKGCEIKKLVVNTDAWPNIYNVLGKIDKNTLINEQIEYYFSCFGCHEWVDDFCKEQIDKLQCGKKTNYDVVEVRELLRLINFILRNKKELLERELSIMFFGDSKKFEKSYRSKVCAWLRKYGNFESILAGIDDKREIEQIILGEYNIFANPSYVYFKGKATISFDNGSKIETLDNLSIALSSISLEHVVSIRIHSKNVMTIENLTSFNRMEKENYFYIFLSGYHNTTKQKLLMKIYEENEHLTWVHFGDLDPDGFYIAEHLKNGTGIPFELYHMSVAELKKYKDYAKRLNENDKTKAISLIEKGIYLDVIQYMLENGYKLEQEIISWMLMQ